MIRPHQRILVIRNDKLGDFMLAWPALALLRASALDAHIAVLVPAYTAPLAKICHFVDEVLIDPKLHGDWRNGRALANILRPKGFDAVVTLFSRFDTGLAVWLAGITYRLAPATKLAQLFYNHRLKQWRSESTKPEYEYNLDLIKQYLKDSDHQELPLPPPPYLHFDTTEIQRLAQDFRDKHGVGNSQHLVFVHAGHGGSANNLSLAQYAELIRGLQSRNGHYVVLTAGPDEEGQVQALSRLLTGIPHGVYISQEGLVKFAMHLQFCDVFISGSTGPLHVAAALNRNTAAFYPRRRSSTALRWQTINDAERRIAFEPPAESRESDMQSIDMASATAQISNKFLQ
ncbi:MAG: glycosyltransferase family 9 protein [Gammaproteobacteria bacterium]